MGVPQNGWDLFENLRKMNDLGGTPILGNLHIYIYIYIYIICLNLDKLGNSAVHHHYDNGSLWPPDSDQLNSTVANPALNIKPPNRLKPVLLPWFGAARMLNICWKPFSCDLLFRHDLLLFITRGTSRYRLRMWHLKTTNFQFFLFTISPTFCWFGLHLWCFQFWYLGMGQSWVPKNGWFRLTPP